MGDFSKKYKVVLITYLIFVLLISIFVSSVHSKIRMALPVENIENEEINYIGKNSFNVHGEFNPSMRKAFIDYIAKLPVGSRITLDIESPGGYAYVLEDMQSLIKLKKLTTTCLVNDHAASAGAFLFISCDEKKISDSAELLFHLPYRFSKTGEIIRDPSNSEQEAIRYISQYQLAKILGNKLLGFLVGKDIVISGLEYKINIGK